MLRATVSVLALVATFVAAVPASAAESAQCAPMLDAAADARAVLEDMERAIADAKADRVLLVERADALALEIAELRAKSPTSKKIVALQAERSAILADIAGTDEIIPHLVRQLDGLRKAVDEAERAYIACVESTI